MIPGATPKIRYHDFEGDVISRVEKNSPGFAPAVAALFSSWGDDEDAPDPSSKNAKTFQFELQCRHCRLMVSGFVSSQNVVRRGRAQNPKSYAKV